MRNINRILKDTGKLSSKQIQEAILEHGEDTNSVWQSLLGTNGLTESDIFEAYAHSLNLEFMEGRELEVGSQLLATVPPALCREQRIIPIEAKDGYIFIGTDNPMNLDGFDNLQAATGLIVAVSVITPSSVNALLNKYFRQDDEITKLSEEIQEDSIEEVATELVEDTTDDESLVVRFVNLLIIQAIRDRASDIHIEPTNKEVRIRYRIDGILHVVQTADLSIKNKLLSRFKIMSGIDTTVSRIPQDGRITFPYQGQKIDIRVVTLPTVWGQKIVARILDSSSLKRDIKSLEMSEVNESAFREAIKKSTGLVLLTGPTGSGKTSSLYAALEEVMNTTKSIVTVEDPVERKIPEITQIEVNKSAGLTVPSALPAIVRSDPDTILIGEIRDTETAQIAIDSSMTGHLVLSTLHTNGAPEAASRLVQMNVEPFLVGSTVSCIIAQRLARRLCEDCKEAVNIKEEALELADFNPKNYKVENLYRPVGCGSCANTGYRGRIPITEVLSMTDDIEELIVTGASARAIRIHAEAHGMVPLKLDGYSKVAAGVTTIEEVLRVSR